MRGTKQERSPGVWRLRMFVGEDPVTGNPRQLSRTVRGTKRQADTALAEFRHQVTSWSVPWDRSTTLRELLDRWIDQITTTRSPTTIRGYKFKIQRIDERLGDIRVSSLTAQQLDRAYRAWLDQGPDASTVHHVHRILSAELRQTVKWDLLTVAPTARATPQPRRQHQQPFPTVEDVRALIDTAERLRKPVLATAIVLAPTTGLRRANSPG